MARKMESDVGRKMTGSWRSLREDVKKSRVHGPGKWLLSAYRWVRYVGVKVGVDWMERLFSFVLKFIDGDDL